jgi:NAD(P)-dependent dehydrogenase (short-subunit alcohol dehydrogenase family)
MSPAGRVAIVTGGASGIGRAICERFARDGAKVVVADLDATMAADTAAGIEAQAGTARAVPLDVRVPDQVEALIAETERALGPPEILVTCAGIGRIVVIGSINSRRPISGRNAYAVSKAGVLSLMQVMATEPAPHGITVNGIAPGPIDTAMARAMHTKAARAAHHAHTPCAATIRPPTSPGTCWTSMAASMPPACCTISRRAKDRDRSARWYGLALADRAVMPPEHGRSGALTNPLASSPPLSSRPAA